MKPLFISFYTNNGYQEEVKRLRASFERFGLEHEIVEFVNPGNDWRVATAHKPRFIMDMLLKHQRPVVWVDADAEVLEPPILFNLMDCTIGVHKRNNREILSGTLYFDYTIHACCLIARWSKYSNEELDTWEQVHLGRAIQNTSGISISYLPVEYCTIFDGTDKRGQPVIAHHQASRRLKKVY